jgi:hypothetical protein
MEGVERGGKRSGLRAVGCWAGHAIATRGCGAGQLAWAIGLTGHVGQVGPGAAQEDGYMGRLQ